VANKGGWVTIDPDKIEVDNKGWTGPHAYTRGSWPVWCNKCGHVALRNPVSELVHKIGCSFKTDQRYIQWVTRNWGPRG
jgi:hypothetical protein